MKFAAVVLSLTIAIAARAADLSGAYTWLGTDAERASIDKAVAASADSANAFIRPIVRKKLAASCRPYTNILVSVSNNMVQFNRDSSDRPVNGPLAGPAVSWEREDGKVYQVTYALAGDTLSQTFKNDDGIRVNAFALTPDGLLKMTVTITASVIKVPLSYVLTFRKASGTP